MLTMKTTMKKKMMQPYLPTWRAQLVNARVFQVLVGAHQVLVGAHGL